jgi:hypothetical protein
LFEFAQREEEHVEFRSSQVVVWENMPLDDFLTYCKSDVRLLVCVYLYNRKIIINKIPIVVYAEVSALIKILMSR